MKHGSKNRLTPRQQSLFTGRTLFDEVARTVCAVGVLPRKELYESWEVARRAARRFKGGRVVDVCAGHGLVGALVSLLDPSCTVVSCDVRLPPSAIPLREALLDRWPRLQWSLMQCPLDRAPVGDTLLAAHACGSLSDDVLSLALRHRARVALLPCCQASTHDFLHGWLDPALAVDTMRAVRLRSAGFSVLTQSIPAEITPKNRLLLAWPAD